MITEIFGISIIILAFIVLILVCREIVCWYLKINQRNALLEEIIELLHKRGR